MMPGPMIAARVSRRWRHVLDGWRSSALIVPNAPRMSPSPDRVVLIAFDVECESFSSGSRSLTTGLVPCRSFGARAPVVRDERADQVVDRDRADQVVAMVGDRDRRQVVVRH